MNRKIMIVAVAIFVLLFVANVALAQEPIPPPTPGDPTTWPPIGDVLGGLANDILTALAPVLAAPLTVAGIALVKYIISKWFDPENKISGTTISIVVALVIYGAWVASQLFGYGEQFVSAAAILAVAFEGIRNVLVLLFGQQVLYLGARRLNVPLFGYSRSLPDGAKQAA